jgi:hypothetical protein
MDPVTRADIEVMADAIVNDGSVVPFLGAGVNLSGRPEGSKFDDGGFLPDARELAAVLAKVVPSYTRALRNDLLRAAQCIWQKRGWKRLYETLHDVFDRDDYEPADVHSFLAELPEQMASLPSPPAEPYLLIATANYDDMLEKALTDAGAPFDVVRYAALGDHAGRFLHHKVDANGGASKAEVIVDPAVYGDEGWFVQRTVILKLHGAVTRGGDPKGNDDSYVITEDDYIRYLTRISKLLPKGIKAKLMHSSMLFLGYSMRDWNLRALFHLLWEEQKGGWRSWAIQQPLDPLGEDPTPEQEEEYELRELEHSLDEQFWDEQSNVKPYKLDLRVFIGALREAVDEALEQARRV